MVYIDEVARKQPRDGILAIPPEPNIRYICTLETSGCSVGITQDLMKSINQRTIGEYDRVLRHPTLR